MRKGRMLLVAGLIGYVGLALSAGHPSAQTGTPSESDIVRQLRPVPQSLGEQQGLPTLGTWQPAAPNPDVRGASLGSTQHRPKVLKNQSSSASAAPTSAAPHPSITFETIQFAFNSAQLTPGSIATLHNLGNALNHELADQKSFRIEGHTDASGELQYNMVLSRRRADAVEDYLVRQAHVDPSRLRTVGKGPTELANPADPDGAENRRVVVINLGG
jgi:outer membrane protein OmpA-like peptidoglycan-associated protein